MSTYPAPDRSNFQKNEYRDDPYLPEGDLGYRVGELPDGRPFRAEVWFTEGMTLVTFFFSVIDLETASPEELMALLVAELNADRIPTDLRTLKPDGVHTITDAAGQVMYSITFAAGLPDL